VDQKQVVSGLLMKVDKYRRLARWVGDSETVRRIGWLVEELKQQARAFAKPDAARIRDRAYEIWDENGRPGGRDLEFWLEAEREFHDAEKLAKEVQEDA
jgi:hypothetical protein